MHLVREAYMQALKSPTITLTLSDTGDAIPCALAFLALHSEYFAKLLSKPGVVVGEGNSQANRIELQNVRKEVVECFVHWCYLGRHLSLGLLDQTSNKPAEGEDLQAEKNTLIDLWIFCDQHSIPRLQNESIQNLLHLLGTHPSLLTPQNIHSIFSRTPDPASPLRRLAFTVLVAQLHSPLPPPPPPSSSSNVPTTMKIEDFDNMSFKGAIPLFYKCMRNWNLFSSKFQGQQLGQNVLLALLETPAMGKLLRVEGGEVQPKRWVLEMCGIVKREEVGEEVSTGLGLGLVGSGLREEPIEVD